MDEVHRRRGPSALTVADLERERERGREEEHAASLSSADSTTPEADDAVSSDEDRGTSE